MHPSYTPPAISENMPTEFGYVGRPGAAQYDWTTTEDAEDE